ncbi:MAG: primosomal protein N' [Gammaproteobacteria bacterium]|nr:primosomal protein N' [Gammaproteobacteria bacterium]
MPPSRFAAFAIALPLYRAFEYRIDDSEAVVAGTRYRLPFGQGTRTGVLLSVSDSTDYAAERIKPIEARLDQRPVLSEHMLALAKWMSEYYLQPTGEVIFQCLPSYLRGSRVYQSLRVKRWQLVDSDADVIDELQSRSPRQFEIGLALLRQPGGMTAAQLKQINPNWHAVVRAMESKQLLRWEWVDAAVNPVIASELPRLSDEQSAILGQIEPRLRHFAVHLLDGITGSGKTEIYLRLIQARLADGLQVIYLVPEIGLTNQLIDRVRQRFGDCFATSHSSLTEYQRYRAWDRFRRGEVRIMLGTRSTLFSQCERLGMIIIDEEHDHSYRQQDGVRYHARDVAIKRAQMLDIPIVLGSATASLESIANCERDTWFHYRIDHRPTRYPPPPIQLIDVRNSRFEFGCAAPTLARIESHLAQSGQVLIYLNRRGFAPVVMCHECGWQSQCRNCDARLTLHQSLQTLLCHHCGFNQAIPETCPDCGHDEIRHYGIGTEQLEQGLRSRYPDTPVLRVDRDVISSRDALKARLQQLQSGESCILIGTQMIAKGHDYPAITLSVVLDADQALFSASYRASESLVQTLFQVSGRSGRGDRVGEAIVQTRFTEHPLMQALQRQGYREIAADLLQERRLLGFPPCARAVIFRADALELKQALVKLEEIKTLLGQARHFERLASVGPIPALMTRRIGRYRAQLCLLSADFQALRSVLSQAMPAIQEIASSPRVSWNVDVDAYDL